MPTQERTCPDCHEMLHEIKLIDKSHLGVHTDLEYTLPEARRSFWSSGYPIEGRVLAFMCPACGRIALYGAARDE